MSDETERRDLELGITFTDEQGNVWTFVDEQDDLQIINLILETLPDGSSTHYAELTLEAEVDPQGEIDRWWSWMTTDTRNTLKGGARTFIEARDELIAAATGWDAGGEEGD
jgi:hypothetical protein